MVLHHNHPPPPLWHSWLEEAAGEASEVEGVAAVLRLLRLLPAVEPGLADKSGALLLVGARAAAVWCTPSFWGLHYSLLQTKAACLPHNTAGACPLFSLAAGLAHVLRHRCATHADPDTRKLAQEVLRKWAPAPAAEAGAAAGRPASRGAAGCGGAAGAAAKANGARRAAPPAQPEVDLTGVEQPPVLRRPCAGLAPHISDRQECVAVGPACRLQSARRATPFPLTPPFPSPRRK